jgi:putative DNA primase/helicase
LIPRLVASGADLNRAYFVADVTDGQAKRPFDPAKDVEPLQRAIKGAGGRGSNYHHRSNHIGRSRGLAQECGNAAFLAAACRSGGRCWRSAARITHFAKGTTGREPIERINGSIAFGALARIVMVSRRNPTLKTEAQGGAFPLARNRTLALTTTVSRIPSNCGPCRTIRILRLPLPYGAGA